MIAASARQLNERIDRVLEHFPSDGKVMVRDLSLGRESLDTIELEPMEVWAKDARIVVYDAARKETLIAPPAVTYFKGRVVGEDESTVFFSRSANGAIRGLIVIGERSWAIATGVRKDGRPTADIRKMLEDPIESNAPLLIIEIEDSDAATEASSHFECEIAEIAQSQRQGATPSLKSDAASSRTPVAEAGSVAGATYQLRIAVETDNELAAGFGNNTTNLTTYIGDLIAKASIVYSRDVNTTLVLGDVHLWTGGTNTDPWLVTSDTGAMVAEFGTYWHNNYSAGYPDPDGPGAGNNATAGGGTAVTRSTAVFVSGKVTGGGIAWVDVLCDDNFYCGDSGEYCGNPTYAGKYAGGYGFNGQTNSFNNAVPDPEATVNGVQYGVPQSNYWILHEVMHELGHNVASPHSSCVPLSGAEQVQYGVARAFVDQCRSGESGCYSGGLIAPAEKGTIMSYCINLMSGGYRQSRYLLGKAGEPSEKMLPIFKGSDDPLQPWLSTGLEGCTADATITAQTQPVACSAGRTASVVACAGCTYAWQIAGGSITSSTTTSSITYTPTQANVTLTVTVLSARGCGITASKAILASCVPVSAPTDVVATAAGPAAVNVTWNAAAGALSYNVYRSANALSYTFVGNAAVTSFSDTTASANTAYLYKVRGVNGGESGDSNRDLATTVIFTDDALVAGTTLIKALHLTEMRTAVNAVRTLASLGAGSFTDPTVTATVTTAKAAHINELRSALGEARSALSLGAVSYGETITASTTTIKGSHVTEVRSGVK